MPGSSSGSPSGVANGVITTRFRINALIATLAMSFVVSGVAALVTQGNLVVAFEALDFKAFATTRILGLTSARLGHDRLRCRDGGRPRADDVRPLPLRDRRQPGGRAARRASRSTASGSSAFALSGLAAGLAGVVDTSRVLSAQANAGTFLAFTVLAGIVVGGTSIMGGEGAVWRTVVGCLFIALIGNGFNLLGLDPFYRQITLGGILLVAVGIDAWSRRTSS